MAVLGTAHLSDDRSGRIVRSEDPLARQRGRSQLFIATNDDELHEVVCRAAKLLGCTAEVLHLGGDALSRNDWSAVSVPLLDQDLRDVPALDVARTFRRDKPAAPFVLIGKGLTVSVTVEAMKLGAFTVLEKPVSWPDMLAACRGALARLDDDALPTARDKSAGSAKPRSSTERWVLHVLKACEAEGDLRTIAAWASFAGLSYSSLCESCRLVGIQPHDARDFTRMLSAVVRSSLKGCRIEELLDISDRRTLKSLMERAGLPSQPGESRVSVDQFLSSQSFVPAGHAVITVLRMHLIR